MGRNKLGTLKRDYQLTQELITRKTNVIFVINSANKIWINKYFSIDLFTFKTFTRNGYNKPKMFCLLKVIVLNNLLWKQLGKLWKNYEKMHILQIVFYNFRKFGWIGRKFCFTKYYFLLIIWLYFKRKKVTGNFS